MEGIECRVSPGKGRGLFATKKFRKGAILEVCPVIVLPKEDFKNIHSSGLYDYYFLWGPKEDKVGIVLGYGMLYNHSNHPNVDTLPDFRRSTMTYLAYRTICPGEELCINYWSDIDCKEPLDFSTPRTWRGY